MSNAHESYARELKASAIASLLYPTLRLALEADSVTEIAEMFDDETWELVRSKAKVLPPSEDPAEMGVSSKTRQRVMELLSLREEMESLDALEGLPR